MDDKFFPIIEDQVYYIVDGKKVYNKFRAIELAGGDLSKIHFYWMDDTWNQANWTSEPNESWLDLLRIRCEQIRNKYQYVSLWYSSGYDSHTILRSFVDNNILLDEVLITDRRQFFDDPEVEIAINHAKYIKETYYPDLYINVVKVTPETHRNFYLTYRDKWIYHPGQTTKFSKTNRYFSKNLSNDYLQTMKKSEKYHRGDVIGLDKARVLLRDGKWYAFLPDGMIFDSMIGNNAENFYYHPDLPAMHIKQCWMVIKWFESLPELTEELVHQIQGKDFDGIFVKYYRRWAEAGGRFPLHFSHRTSITGEHKHYHAPDETSIDSIKLLNYFKEHEKQVYDIYMNGLTEIRRINQFAEHSTATNTTILSNQYFIKNLYD